jgi:PPOX class probable F420-dependent enzyme
MAHAATKQLTDEQVKLFTDANFLHFGTIMPDGSPQVTPVWVDYRDGLVWVNSAEGRVKDRNVRRDPRVSLSILDEKDPYGGVFFSRGRVVDITTEGAKEHIDFLAKKYLGKDVYPWHRSDEQRVIYKIQPE